MDVDKEVQITVPDLRTRVRHTFLSGAKLTAGVMLATAALLFILSLEHAYPGVIEKIHTAVIDGSEIAIALILLYTFSSRSRGGTKGHDESSQIVGK